MPYTCHDCGATFDAPTDTETVACPGCGGPAFQETGADPDLAESLAADVHYLLGYIGPHPHADGSTGCGHCARVAVARANVRTADERPTQPAPPVDLAGRRIRYATQISKGGFGQSLRELTDAAIAVADAEQAELRYRIRELERPAVEAKRAEIRQSLVALAAQAEQDRDFEGAFDVQCRLREFEERWALEDNPRPAPSPAVALAVANELTRRTP